MARGGSQTAIRWLSEEAGFAMPPPGQQVPVYAQTPAARLVQVRFRAVAFSVGQVPDSEIRYPNEVHEVEGQQCLPRL